MYFIYSETSKTLFSKLTLTIKKRVVSLISKRKIYVVYEQRSSRLQLNGSEYLMAPHNQDPPSTTKAILFYFASNTTKIRVSLNSLCIKPNSRRKRLRKASISLLQGCKHNIQLNLCGYVRLSWIRWTFNFQVLI